MLCYVTPKEHLGLPEPRRREARRDRLQNRRPCGRHRPAIGRVPAIATTPCRKARFEFDWNEQFRLSLDPETARAYHDETLAAGHVQERPLLQHVRPEVLLDEDHGGYPEDGGGGGLGGACWKTLSDVV